MKNKFNIALVGCGRIGFLLEKDPLRYKPCTHYGGALAAKFTINYACDINKTRLKNFAQTTKIPQENCFTNYSDLFRQSKIDAAIISTWTESHDSIAIEAAKSGIKLIILEKPIASSLAKAKNILMECKKNNVHVILNHERRYDNRYNKLKNIIENKIIGDVKTIHASMLTSGHTGQSKIKDGGGPLLHDGTHLIDIIRYIFGEIKSVEGRFDRLKRNKGFEDRAVSWLRTDNDIDIFLEAGGNRNYFVFELEISGTNGKIIIGNGYEKLFLKKKSKLYSGFQDLEEKKFPLYSKSKKCFYNLYNDAKKILNNENESKISTGLDGYKALEIIHSIYLSSHLDGKKILLPIDPESVDLGEIFSIS